ncbi:MAG: hypothetical protein ACK4VV_02410 [Pseudomonas sp.]
MKTTTVSRALYISALSLTLALTGAQAVAGGSSKHDADNGAHMEGERTPQQQRDEQMRRDSDDDLGTGSDARPGEGATDPSGTDATRHVPGAPERGTNPATEPGTGTSQ